MLGPSFPCPHLVQPGLEDAERRHVIERYNIRRLQEYTSRTLEADRMMRRNLGYHQAAVKRCYCRVQRIRAKHVLPPVLLAMEPGAMISRLKTLRQHPLLD